VNCNIYIFFLALCGGAFPPLLTDICEILDQNTNHFIVVHGVYLYFLVVCLRLFLKEI